MYTHNIHLNTYIKHTCIHIYKTHVYSYTQLYLIIKQHRSRSTGLIMAGLIISVGE